MIESNKANKSIYIWGAGHYGVLTALDLEQKNIKITGFIDVYADKIKTRLGLQVLTLSNILTENPYIIIAIKNENTVKEITEKLYNAGLKIDNDFSISNLITGSFNKPSYEVNLNYLHKNIQNYFTKHKNNSPTEIVYMSDDTRAKGGLADRLRGIISLYKICKIYGFKFKINFTEPFDLSDYLLPNIYDWRISPDEISHQACKISNFPFYKANTDSYCGLSFKDFIPILCNYAKTNSQILVYTNMSYNGNDYGTLFNELFKFSKELQNSIDFHRNKMNNDYISVSYRFLQLLGDFSENADFPTLPIKLQNSFLQQMLNHLISIYEQNKGLKILVCSDSEKFINAVKKYNFVYTVKGKRQHIDNPKIEEESIMLTFTDYFLISYSKEVYLIVDEIEADGIKYESYRSGFPKSASQINNVKYTVKDYTPRKVMETDLEVLENFIANSSLEEIKEATENIFLTVKENIERMKTLKESVLIHRFKAVLDFLYSLEGVK